MKLKRNFSGFIWHAFWLALAETFAEKNTILPGLILIAGGTQVDIGILTSIMIGVPLISQILFAGYLINKTHKKRYLLLGIYLRVFAFTGIGFSIFHFNSFAPQTFIMIVFTGMILFSLSGAFAGISYTDIVGKSFHSAERKYFFVIRQVLTSVGILISALLVTLILKKMSYPQNYQAAFFSAGAMLFVASIGFSFLREKASETSDNFKNLFSVIKHIPSEIKKNLNLKYYMIITNLEGFTFVLIPFYVGFINSKYSLTSEDIANFLLAQIIGMVLSNLFWKKLVQKYAFIGMLKTTIILLGLLPLIALSLQLFDMHFLYYGLFILSGAAISAKKIYQDGIIIEISNESNRPLYSGIYGSLNITSAVFPLLLGLILESSGYFIVFISLSLLSMTSLFFVNKMNCNTNTPVT
ncbi:MAG: MFS transporter [Melioribacteraceae bacterium]|nr:MFS transporter [Melioribacteraceae bacterium]MCF8354601.1 MFS transporter [Melioribacteraceae bacterium]MCF8394953.1 MFS transporter [Melioribacteraceae bacterium]MCF8420178.1 MFS transporter [Melioribacteraceae bacterium]